MPAILTPKYGIWISYGFTSYEPECESGPEKLHGWRVTWCWEVLKQTPQLCSRNSGKVCLFRRSHPLPCPPSVPWPQAKAAFPSTLAHCHPGNEARALSEASRRTDRQTAGRTHLRNTEPGLSGAPCWASQALSGLPGTSNLNSVSLEDRLFFTILHLSVCPQAKERAQRLISESPAPTWKSAFSSAQSWRRRQCCIWLLPWLRLFF